MSQETRPLTLEAFRLELLHFSQVELHHELEILRNQLIKDMREMKLICKCKPFTNGTTSSSVREAKPWKFDSEWEPLLWQNHKEDEPIKVDEPVNAREIRLVSLTKPRVTFPVGPAFAEHVSYSHVPETDIEGDIVEHEVFKLDGDITEIMAKEQELQHRIADLDDLWADRRRPFVLQLEQVRRAKADYEMTVSYRAEIIEDGPPPVGPSCLDWVDSTWFSVACNVMVALNLAIMGTEKWLSEFHSGFQTLDQIFLCWYVAELFVKIVYRQHDLFFGKFHVVWWNWLDLFIVVGGVVEQWVMPLVQSVVGGGSGAGGVRLPISSTALRGFRFLRLFRIMRIFKLVKSFLLADLSWMESPRTETFLSGVIAVNAAVMALELDYDDLFGGMLWKVVENAFLLIYFAELILKVKRWGCRFFFHPEQYVWNCLDALMVIGGVTDLWLMPASCFVQTTVSGEKCTFNIGKLGSILSLLRIMRLLRILRLVRLVRTITPLYRLLVGVMEALRAMQWVLLLTLIILYAAAILFTSCVGKGYLYGGTPPAGAKNVFDTVPQSLFSLFKLMNGDIEIVNPICHTVTGRLLFMGFMVLSNWAILAVLTSVVSDNMIAASARTIMEDENLAKEEANKSCVRRLTTLFHEIDTDGSGEISETEWKDMLKHPALAHELTETSGMALKDLSDLFVCFSSEKEGSRVLHYQDFIENVKHEDIVADRRSILHIMTRLRTMEHKIDRRLSELKEQ